MTNDIVDYTPEQLDDRSKTLVESGFFPDLKSVAQAKVKVWIGRSLGLSEFQSLTGVYVTQKGQIGLAAITMGALVKSSGRYNYIIEKIDETECIINFFRIKGDEEIPIGTSTFNLKDAAKCGLVNKDTFKSFPRNMLMCRALANGCRWYAPETICGYYAIEEIEEMLPEDRRETITITPEGNIEKGENNGETKLSE